MTRFLSLLLIGGIFLCACKTPTEGQQQQSTANQGSVIPTDEPACFMDQSAVITSLDDLKMGGDTTDLFPFVYQGMGRTNLFEAYSMRFQLCYDEFLVPMTNDMVQWINAEVYNEYNGYFMTYIRQGRDPSLTNPYIHVQYIGKDLPYCGSVDSVYMFFDQKFVDEGGAKVLMNMQEVKTGSGKIAYCKEYLLPGQTTPRGKSPDKHLAYAYIDYDEDYIIGMALTATIETDFPLNRPSFYKLVKSFNYF